VSTSDHGVDFYIVIASYNNEKWYQKNLSSVFQQEYPHWRLCYINDCSTDTTGKSVEEYIDLYGMRSKCRVIHNSSNRGAMANLYTAIHMAKPTEIVVIVDGDDALANPRVLKYLAHVYQNKNIWMTYGSYKCDPSGQQGLCEPFPRKVLQKGTFRKYKWIASHLKTFYAKLFHLIKKEDLMRDGKFLPITYDQAITYPLLEMAGNAHIRYIRRTLYLYNDTNPISDSRRAEFQYRTALYIRSLPPYAPVKRLFPREVSAQN
jgi:glycosyltransferase involved in cell wall biosynthesis